MSEFYDWVHLGNRLYVRRSQVIGISVVGSEVEVYVSGMESRRVFFSNADEAEQFGLWLLRKTDDPPEVLLNSAT